MNFKKVIILAFICLICANTNAQKNNQNEPQSNNAQSNVYAGNDNWYILLQGGMNMLFCENTRGTVREAYSLSIGKAITPVWGIRLQAIGGRNKNGGMNDLGFMDDMVFNNVNIYATATFNITNAARKTKIGEEKPFNVFLMAGPGYARTFNYKDVKGKPSGILNFRDGFPSNSFTFLGGASLNYAFNEYVSLDFAIIGNIFTDKYNHYIGDFPLDGTINALLGIGVKF